MCLRAQHSRAAVQPHPPPLQAGASLQPHPPPPQPRASIRPLPRTKCSEAAGAAETGLESGSMRRLGIDARKLADFGIGSYLQGLLGELVELVAESDLVILVAPEVGDLLPMLPDRWRLVEVEAAGYTVREQLVLPLAARARRREGPARAPLRDPARVSGTHRRHHSRHHPRAVPGVPPPRVSALPTPAS